MERKTLELEIKSIEEDGTFEGYANAYDVVDLGGDLVESGAFAKSISEHPSVPIMFEHNDLVGSGVLQDTPSGPFIKGRLSLAVQKARDVYEFIKSGALTKLSIGWMPVKSRKGGDIRRVTEGRIFEVSLVAVPMNELATITAFKAGRRISAATRKELEAALKVITSLIDEDAGVADDPLTTTPADDADATKALEPEVKHENSLAAHHSTLLQIQQLLRS